MMVIDWLKQPKKIVLDFLKVMNNLLGFYWEHAGRRK